MFYPKGFLGYFINKKLIGYIIGHPWKEENVVPINYLGDFPKDPNCFYIHDIAINLDYRKRGYGKELMKAILDVGENDGFRKFMLVAVNENAKKLCENFGFNVHEEILYGQNVRSYKMIMSF